MTGNDEIILETFLEIEFGAEIDEKDWRVQDFGGELSIQAKIMLEHNSINCVDKEIIKKLNKFAENDIISDMKVYTATDFYNSKGETEDFIVVLYIDKEKIIQKVLEHDPSQIKNIGEDFFDCVDLTKFSHLGDEYGMFDQIKEQFFNSDFNSDPADQLVGIDEKEYDLINQFFISEFNGVLKEQDVDDDIIFIGDYYMSDEVYDFDKNNILVTFDIDEKTDKKMLKNVLNIFDKDKIEINNITFDDEFTSIKILVNKKYLLDSALTNNPSLIKNVGQTFKGINKKKYSHLGSEYDFFNAEK